VHSPVVGPSTAWSQWWGEGVLDALVRKDERRLEIEAEFPHVPLAFFEAPIAVPTGWCASRCAYVLLSEAYRQDANRAPGLGWPVVERPGAPSQRPSSHEDVRCSGLWRCARATTAGARQPSNPRSGPLPR
jgi:hypothetical protein